jgi:5-enolpyruvylshikimate-3-phosphate synthase
MFEEVKEAVDLPLAGEDFISRFMVVFSVLCDGKNEIRNFSVNKNSMNLIKILRDNLGIDISLDQKMNTLTVVGKKDYFNLAQPVNVIDVGSSLENLIFLAILVSNQNFKTFITGNEKILEMDLSFLQKYIKDVDVIFNIKNRLPLLIFGKPFHCDRTSFVADNTLDKNFLLLSSLFNKYDTVNIIDENIRGEFIESVLKCYGFQITEKYFQHTSFLTWEVKKCKDITIFKKKPLRTEPKVFEVPVDLKEAIYSIFLFLFSDREEIFLKNVAINEYNETIVKILTDSGLNIQFKNQKILNGIKVSDVVVKQSALKPISISKIRLRETIEYYPFIILLNILKGNSFTIMGIDLLKKYDGDNYEFILKFCRAMGCRMEENRGNLDFVSDGELQLSDHEIKPEKLNPKINMFLFLIGLLKEKNISLGVDFGLVEEEFPNVNIVLNTLNFKINE